MGICHNSICPAFNDAVLHNHGLREFGIDDIKSARCPKCDLTIDAIRLTLNNCVWRFEGIKEQEPEKLLQVDWENVGNHVIYYDQSLTGSVKWLSLKIQVERTITQNSIHVKDKKSLNELATNNVILPNKIFCSICLKSNKHNNSIEKLKCSHIFHVDCISQWAKRSNECPM